MACFIYRACAPLLRTLAIAEYGIDDSIEGTVKEGNRSIMLGSIQGNRQRREPKHYAWFHTIGGIVSLVDGFGPIKGQNDSWVWD